MSFAECAYDLSFDEEPNYGKIRFLFIKNLLDNNDSPTRDFDWNRTQRIDHFHNLGKISGEDRDGAHEDCQYAEFLLAFLQQ